MANSFFSPVRSYDRTGNSFFSPIYGDFGNGFKYRQALTVDHTKVTGSVSNFPVLVVLTDTTLKTVANGGHVQSASGYDIGFYSGTDLGTKLSWEVQKYDGSAGTLVAWVLVPSLSPLTDTTFQMAYGNAGITSFQGNASAVWTSYAGVWHFGDGVSANYNDSTANANNGTPSASTPSVGTNPWGAGALSLSGTAQYLNVGQGASLDIAGAITISAWIKPTDRANYNSIIAKSTAGSGLPAPYDMFMTQTSGIPAFLQGNGNSPGGGLDLYEADGTTAPANGSWSHICATIASGNDGAAWVWYLNGATNGSGNVSRTNPAGTKAVNVYIGSRTDFVTMFKGLMADVRISSSVRTGGWVGTEYANQSSPSTFLTSGGEVSL